MVRTHTVGNRRQNKPGGRRSCSRNSPESKSLHTHPKPLQILCIPFRFRIHRCTPCTPAAAASSTFRSVNRNARCGFQSVSLFPSILFFIGFLLLTIIPQLFNSFSFLYCLSFCLGEIDGCSCLLGAQSSKLGFPRGSSTHSRGTRCITSAR